MARAVALVSLLSLASLAVSLAAAPQPMACDAWSCSGNSCAPAKYAAVRNVPVLPPLLASPVYAASALILAGSLLGVLLSIGIRIRKRVKARHAVTAMLVLLLAAPLVASDAKEESKQVICVLCGDYTFDAKLGIDAHYDGTAIHLCSLSELEDLKKNPDKYIWATDVVSGAKVNKLRTPYTVDRKVQVRKVKYGNKLEVWPRRFFFESATSRDEFVQNAAKYLKEPYDVN